MTIAIKFIAVATTILIVISITVNIIRPRWYVCVSVCPVHCDKTADRIWMRFGMVGQMGLRMKQIVGVWIGLREGIMLGANVGRPIVTNGEFDAACLQINLGNLVLFFTPRSKDPRG